jgi:hypothetical protein
VKAMKLKLIHVESTLRICRTKLYRTDRFFSSCARNSKTALIKIFGPKRDDVNEGFEDLS